MSIPREPTAAFAPRRDRGLLSIGGRDRRSYLHAILTNDIARLEPGMGCYAAALTPQGRMISDMVVMALAIDALEPLESARMWLDVPAEVADRLTTTLDQSLFTEDVEINNATGSIVRVDLMGDGAAAIIADLFGLPADQLEPHHHVAAANTRTIIARDALALGAAFSIYVHREHESALSQRLTGAGATAVGLDVFDTRRIEAGIPTFGVDMDEDTIPLEAGIEDRAISFTKGCYPGQEVIIRVLHRGHGRVARKLVGLTIDGDVPPAASDAIGASGRITSAAFSTELGHPIALGYVPRTEAAAGTRVTISHGDEPLSATVTTLPFINRGPRLVIAAAVVQRDGRYLITKRPPGVHLEGYWEFPGGKCEKDETLDACLARELREELDVGVGNIREMMAVEHQYADRSIRIHFLACALEGDPRPVLGQELRWVMPEELGGFQFPPADRELVEQLTRG